MDALSPLLTSQLKQIDMGKLQKAPRELLERIKEADQAMYREAVIPKTGIYAEVKVNGETVAKVSNSGGVETANNFAGNIREMMEDINAQGPEAARQIADKIAEAIGGKVVMADTAKTQAEWQNREAVTWKLNTDRLEQHGFDVSQELENMRFSTAKLANETLGTLLDYSEV